MKHSDICRETLDILHDALPMGLPEDVIQRHLKARLRVEPSKAAFDDALHDLKQRGFISSMEPEFDGDPARWHLTEAGEVKQRR